MHIGQTTNSISLFVAMSGTDLYKLEDYISSPDFKLCLPFSAASPRRGRGAPLSPIPPLVPYLPHSFVGFT